MELLIDSMLKENMDLLNTYWYNSMCGLLFLKDVGSKMYLIL